MNLYQVVLRYESEGRGPIESTPPQPNIGFGMLIKHSVQYDAIRWELTLRRCRIGQRLQAYT